MPGGTDCIGDGVWLAPDLHDFFECSQLAIVPVVASAAYDHTGALITLLSE